MTRHYVVPGRVELVGKHVDYAGGRSLTCAVDRALRVEAEATNKPVLQVDAGPERGVAAIPLDRTAAPTAASWSVYVAAVARRIARDFPHFRCGVEVRISGNLPEGAGLSSSSALIVALGTALADANDAKNDELWRREIPDALARAEYFAAIETGAPYREFAGEEGVGVRGGAQDPIAIVCGEAGAMSEFSYLPPRLRRRVPWPSEYVLAIGVSGVHAVKPVMRSSSTIRHRRRCERSFGAGMRRPDVATKPSLQRSRAVRTRSIGCVTSRGPTPALNIYCQGSSNFAKRRKPSFLVSVTRSESAIGTRSDDSLTDRLR